jgi:hypothetical protein
LNVLTIKHRETPEQTGIIPEQGVVAAVVWPLLHISGWTLPSAPTVSFNPQMPILFGLAYTSRQLVGAVEVPVIGMDTLHTGLSWSASSRGLPS